MTKLPERDEIETFWRDIYLLSEACYKEMEALVAEKLSVFMRDVLKHAETIGKTDSLRDSDGCTEPFSFTQSYFIGEKYFEPRFKKSHETAVDVISSPFDTSKGGYFSMVFDEEAHAVTFTAKMD